MLPQPPPQPPPRRRGGGRTRRSRNVADIDPEGAARIDFANPLSAANLKSIQTCMGTLQKLAVVFEPPVDMDSDQAQPEGHDQLSEVLGFSHRLISYLYILVNMLSRRVASHDAKDTNQDTEYGQLKEELDAARREALKWKAEYKVPAFAACRRALLVLVLAISPPAISA